MGSMIVRGLSAQDKSWLRNESKRLGVSMEELMRRFIRERREQAACRLSLPEAFREHFGPEHGVELPQRTRCGYRPLGFPDEGDA